MNRSGTSSQEGESGGLSCRIKTMELAASVDELDTKDPENNPAITPKTELNSLCMTWTQHQGVVRANWAALRRIIGRFMKKGETAGVRSWWPPYTLL